MKNMKKIIGLLLIVTLVFTAACGRKDTGKKGGTGKDTTNKEPIVNTEEGVIGTKEEEGLKFENTSVVINAEGTETTYVTQVTNVTDQTIYLQAVKIHLKDAEGNLITTLDGYLGENIAPGEVSSIISYTDMNLKDAKTVEYEIVKPAQQ